jgi:serine/threonine protein kinase/Leucine-rich repeat (LRR) protein
MRAGECPAREILYSFAEGRSAADDWTPLASHLSECADCQSALDAYSQETCASGRISTLARRSRPFLDEPEYRHALHRVEQAIVRQLRGGPDVAALAHSGGAPSTAVHEPPAGRTDRVPAQLGPYRIYSPIGRGGMGTVFRAQHVLLDKAVAVKVLDLPLRFSPELVQRFEREMKAVGRLEHPRLVRATDAGEAEGLHYLVMELLDGADAATLLRRAGPPPTPEACEIIRQAAEGLHHAHENGLVHRDVKPSNLMLTSDGQVKILDLGLALVTENSEGGLTEWGQLLGTPEYMAPEQTHDSHRVDHRADLYGLGATLFHLLTGTPPFPRERYGGKWGLIAAHSEAPVPSLRQRRPEIPDELERIVQRLLAKSPEERFPSAESVFETLTPFAVGADLAAWARQAADPPEESQYHTAFLDTAPDNRASEPTARQARNSSLRRWTIGTVALLLIAAACAAALMFSLKTEKGTLYVQVDGVDAADVRVEVDNQAVAVEPTPDRKALKISVNPGTHELAVTYDGLTLNSDASRFEIAAGGDQTIRAWFEPKTPARKQSLEAADARGAPPAEWSATPEQQAFFDRIAAFPAEGQVGAVRAKLMDVNPGFDGKISPDIQDGEIVGLVFSTDYVTEIWPVRGLPGLRTLDMGGTEPRNGKLTDLSPLAGLRLTHLNIKDTRVANLAPLQGMPLSYFNCQGTAVTDLSPLHTVPLKHLRCQVTEISDLSPLEGKSLETIWCGNSRVSDLSPLKKARLTELQCAATRITDFSPLKGMPLRALYAEFLRVPDLSPLKGMPLARLWCDLRLFDPEQDEVLKSLPLVAITGVWSEGTPMDEFWHNLESRREAAHAFADETSRLPPEEQAATVAHKLKELNDGRLGEVGRVVEGEAVLELTLTLHEATHDLTPLMAFGSLRKLTLIGGPDWLDLSPLTHLPLTDLTCREAIAFKNSPILRKMADLKTINGQTTHGYLDTLHPD